MTIYIVMQYLLCYKSFYLQAQDGLRDTSVIGVQTCVLPIPSVPDAGPASGTEARDPPFPPAPSSSRSEERRVGKECRSRWTTYHSKKKRKATPTKTTPHRRYTKHCGSHSAKTSSLTGTHRPQ